MSVLITLTLLQYCMFIATYCMFIGTYCLLSAICCMFIATYCMFIATCCLLSATYCMFTAIQSTMRFFKECKVYSTLALIPMPHGFSRWKPRDVFVEKLELCLQKVLDHVKEV